MLHADLAFADLTAPLEMIEGGFSLAGSRVALVTHRALRAVVLDGVDRTVVVLLERFADDEEGIEFVSDAPAPLIDARLGSLRDHPFDFAVLAIDRRRREVRYTASPLISIPVWCLADGARVRLDWDYARLLGDRPHPIAWDQVLASIAGVPAYGPRTMVDGLLRATAGATLVVAATGADAVLPDPVRHDGPSEVPPGLPVEELFRDTIVTLLDARPVDAARTAVELSGGMDSALTALATAAAVGPGAMSLGAQFAGAMGEEQRQRRLLLCRRGGFADLSLPAERYAPFGPLSLRRQRYQVWPEDENYPELFEASFHLLRGAGIDTLVSGFGGDELYFAYHGEGEVAAAAAAPAPAPPFLTPRGVRTASAERTDYPAAWLRQSCWQSAAGQAQRVLRYGLWPIYPYLNVTLARFVSRLPAAYRRDRQLLRRTLTGMLGEPVFERAYTKESFDPVARRGIAENRAYLGDLLRRSPLARHPDIDTVAAAAALEGDIDRLDRPTYNALFRLLKVACFFQDDD